MSTAIDGPAQVVNAQHVMHLNLNTTDIEGSNRFYTELLGLDLRMQSSGDDGDWSFAGLDEPVSSAGWFLYDDRGPRTSPALELVLWRKPATLGAAYPHVVHRGLTAVGFRVPTLDGLAEKAQANGGTVVGPIADSSGTSPSGLLVRDPDGVHVEVYGAGPESVRLQHARIGCADLERSLEWYAKLGFRQTAPPQDAQLTVGDETLRLRSARVALADGAVELELTQWIDPVASEPAQACLWNRGMVRMAISVEDVDDSREALRLSGEAVPDVLTFELPGTKIGSLRVLFLNDPDGFTVELVHRPSKHFKRPAQG